MAHAISMLRSEYKIYPFHEKYIAMLHKMINSQMVKEIDLGGCWTVESPGKTKIQSTGL